MLAPTLSDYLLHREETRKGMACPVRHLDDRVLHFYKQFRPMRYDSGTSILERMHIGSDERTGRTSSPGAPVASGTTPNSSTPTSVSSHSHPVDGTHSGESQLVTSALEGRYLRRQSLEDGGWVRVHEMAVEAMQGRTPPTNSSRGRKARSALSRPPVEQPHADPISNLPSGAVGHPQRRRRDPPPSTFSSTTASTNNVNRDQHQHNKHNNKEVKPKRRYHYSRKKPLAGGSAARYVKETRADGQGKPGGPTPSWNWEAAGARKRNPAGKGSSDLIPLMWHVHQPSRKSTEQGEMRAPTPQSSTAETQTPCTYPNPDHGYDLDLRLDDTEPWVNVGDLPLHGWNNTQPTARTDASFTATSVSYQY